MEAVKRVLFVCVGNTCRSQMAEGFMKALGGGSVEVRSAGTWPMGFVNRDTTSVMAEKGIDISKQTSDRLTEEMLDWADVVVTLGCCSAEELCPVSFKGKKHDWPVEDPLGKPMDTMRRVSEDVEARVKALLEELNCKS